MQEGKEGS